MTNPSTQVPVEKKQTNTALIIMVVVLLSLFIILPLCIILSVIAIVAINPAGYAPSPTPAPIFLEDENELVWETNIPSPAPTDLSDTTISIPSSLG